MWYEIRTGSTECIEEVRAGSSTTGSKQGATGKGKEKEKEKQDEDGDGDAVMADTGSGGVEEEIDFGDIGGIEEEEPERISKLKVSLTIP